VSDGPVRSVLYSAIALDVPDGPVRAILYGAVALDVSDGPVRAVLYGAVALDVTDGAVTAVLETLGKDVTGDKQGCRREKEEKNVFHGTRIYRSLTKIVKQSLNLRKNKPFYDSFRLLR
jgi:hypothetical protein